jgi:hypothetical protein
MAALPPVCPAPRRKAVAMHLFVSSSLRPAPRGEQNIQGSRGGPSKEAALAGAAGVGLDSVTSRPQWMHHRSSLMPVCVCM